MKYEVVLRIAVEADTEEEAVEMARRCAVEAKATAKRIDARPIQELCEFPRKKVQILAMEEGWTFEGILPEWVEDNRPPIFGQVEEPIWGYLYPVKRDRLEAVKAAKRQIMGAGVVVVTSKKGDIYLGLDQRGCTLPDLWVPVAA